MSWQRARRLGLGVAGFSLLAALLLVLSSGDLDRSARRTLDATRSLRPTWVWHYDPREKDAYVPTYRALLRAMPEDGRVLVAVSSLRDALSFCSELGMEWAEDERITYVNVRRSLSGWARDRYIAFETRDARRVVHPLPHLVRSHNRGDVSVPKALSAQDDGLEIVELSFSIEGGDVLVAGDRVLVGETTVASHAGGNVRRESALLRNLQRVFNRRPLVVRAGGRRIPCPHIDMLLGVVDDSTLVLGDPRLAIAPWPEVDGVPVDLATFGALGVFSRSRQLDLADAYDAIAAQLRAEGFAVRRVPALHGRTVQFLHGGGPRRYGGAAPVLSWTNVLLDRRVGRKTVWLPHYGVAHLDALAHEVWEGLGFVVHAVDTRGPVVLAGGLRCITNEVSTIDLDQNEPPFMTPPCGRP